jgi:hypothetical protein
MNEHGGHEGGGSGGGGREFPGYSLLDMKFLFEDAAGGAFGDVIKTATEEGSEKKPDATPDLPTTHGK